MIDLQPFVFKRLTLSFAKRPAETSIGTSESPNPAAINDKDALLSLVAPSRSRPFISLPYPLPMRLLAASPTSHRKIPDFVARRRRRRRSHSSWSGSAPTQDRSRRSPPKTRTCAASSSRSDPPPASDHRTRRCSREARERASARVRVGACVRARTSRGCRRGRARTRARAHARSAAAAAS